MGSRFWKRVLIALLCAAPVGLRAQDFEVFDRKVQVHGFFSQGFAYSNQNNFLTMDTSQGSGKFTDVGLNLSTNITDKLRVGAQVYDRDIGELGRWHPKLDWASLDYKFNNHFGIRVGKIKTALGLYNQTQDAEFLHTWALLPQSVYPLDLRSNLLAHTGVDVYGSVSLHRSGSLAYTFYWGREADDHTSGWYYSNNDIQYPVKDIKADLWGGDLRWTTPLNGLTTGVSYASPREHWDGVETFRTPNTPYVFLTPNQRHAVVYVDYQVGKWHLDGEGMANHDYGWIWDNVANWTPYPYGYLGWYVSAAYRVNKHLELGAYDSQYEYIGTPASDHCFDRAVTARIDLNRFWDVKVEEHFMNGNGGAVEGAAHGFYLFDNPTLQHTTNLLVVRTGFNF